MGCSPSVSSFKVPEPPLADQATIYIYRPSGVCWSWFSPSLLINQEKVLQIGHGSHTRIFVKTGDYLVETVATWEMAGASIKIEAKAQQEYYIHFNVNCVLIVLPVGQIEMELVSQEEALSEMPYTTFLEHSLPIQETKEQVVIVGDVIMY